MAKRKGIIGLISGIGKQHSRCMRCEIPLQHSTHQGVLVCYSINKVKKNDFLCIQCALRKATKTSKPRVTNEELDIFVAQLPKEPLVMIQH